MGHICFWISWKPVRYQGVSIRMEEAAEDRGRMEERQEPQSWLGVDRRARTAIRQPGDLLCKAEAGNRAGTMSGSWGGIRNCSGLRKPHGTHESCKRRHGRGTLGCGSIHCRMVANIWAGLWSLGDLLWLGGQRQLPCLAAA